MLDITSSHRDTFFSIYLFDNTVTNSHHMCLHMRSCTMCLFFCTSSEKWKKALCRIYVFESKSIDMNENNSPRKKKKRFSVCTAEDVEAASKKKVSKNTLTAVNLAFQVFEDWVTHSSYVGGRCYKVRSLVT